MIRSVVGMDQSLNIVLIAAVVVFILVRRFSARQVSEGKLYVLPLILGVVAIVQGHLADPHHYDLSVGLLAAEVAAAALLGLGLGATMRVWRGSDGVLWSKGTWATLGLFVLSIGVRGGIMAIGYAAGVKPGSGPIMLSVAAWLLAQNAVVAWRARTLTTARRASLVS